jgi:hypothetical protein
MKGTIEYCNISLDVTYDHDVYQDKHEIQVTNIYVVGSSVDIWDIFDAGRLIESIETEILEQLYL